MLGDDRREPDEMQEARRVAEERGGDRDDPRARAGVRNECLDLLADGRHLLGAEIQDLTAARGALGGEEASIGEVPGARHLHAVPSPAEQIDGLPLTHPLEEQNEHAGHARPEEAHRAEDRDVEAALEGAPARLLARDLAPPVGAERPLGMILPDRDRAGDAIDARAGDVHHLTDAGLEGGGEDVLDAREVHGVDLLLVEAGELRLHALRSGEVVHDLDVAAGVREGPAVAGVGADEVAAGAGVVGRRDDIQQAERRAAGPEPVDETGAEEPGGARHQGPSAAQAALAARRARPRSQSRCSAVSPR